jgi:hypothetical protein
VPCLFHSGTLPARLSRPRTLTEFSLPAKWFVFICVAETQLALLMHLPNAEVLRVLVRPRASSESSYVTGIELFVDGGMTPV